jgi:hypothetical protein
VEHEPVAVVPAAGADGDVLDRDVAGIGQFVAVVLRHELVQARARVVRAEPDEVSGPHPPGVRDRLEVLQVAGQFQGLEPGGKAVTKQVAGHQMSQRHAVQPIAEGVLPAAHPGRVLGKCVLEARIKVTREHLIHCPPPFL